MKKLIAAFVVLSLVTVLVVACGGSSDNGNATNTPASGGSGSVHMGADTFLQSSVTISKGSSLNLIDDAAVVHIIENGSWMGNTPKPATEPGAPTVNNLMFSTAGQSQTVGPFNTASTYHLFCTVHPGMNLTVTVQ